MIGSIGEGVMLQCEFCRGGAVELVRTAARVWLGCPRCHQTWNVDLASYHAAIVDPVARRENGSSRASLIRGCVIASLAVAMALTVRLLLRPAIASASPFLLFTPAVAISAIYGGLVPGVLATILSTILGSHFFLAGIGEPVIEKWDRVVLFVIVGAVLTGAATLLRRSRQQLAESLWREQKARAVAEAADRAKDDFLALVSHELQTPMSVVLGWITVLRQKRMNPELAANALGAIERNAQILSRLVDDVLDRSRFATGTLKVDRHLISLMTVVRAAVDQMQSRIESAGLTLDVTESRAEPMISGDSVRLQQVLTNLLTNAVKFTPSGGHISVAVTQDHSRATVTVVDTGAGIPAGLLPHVFDPFRQGSQTFGRSSHGLGLGLAIARDLIEQHQGSINATSDGPGTGSTFTIVLPLAEPPLHSLGMLETIQTHGEEQITRIH